MQGAGVASSGDAAEGGLAGCAFGILINEALTSCK